MIATPPDGFSGVLTPVVTPYREDLCIDAERFVAQCQWLLDQGGDGLAIFGTTSEANSLSLDEKLALLDRLADSGIPAARLMPGTGATALPDTVRLTKAAVTYGCGGVLLLPPFYYKAVSDEGLFRALAETIERVGDTRLRVYLYHIPPVAQVGWSLPLIERILKAYPETVVGLKDSSGDWSNTEAILKAFPSFRVFVGSEVFLLDNMRAGGAGCITATANVNVGAIRRAYERWQDDDGPVLQDEITRVRKTIQDYPAIPALKTILAHYRDDPDWNRLRPPLLPLSVDKAEALLSALQAIGFELGRETVPTG